MMTRNLKKKNLCELLKCTINHVIYWSCILSNLGYCHHISMFIRIQETHIIIIIIMQMYIYRSHHTCKS